MKTARKYLQIREHRCDLFQRSASTGALEPSTSPDADRGSVPARMQTSYTLVAKSPDAIASNLSYGGGTVPANILASAPPLPAPAPLSRMLFSHFFGTPTAAATIPSTSASVKDTVLDLSNPAPNKQQPQQQQFLPVPAIPQQC